MSLNHLSGWFQTKQISRWARHRETKNFCFVKGLVLRNFQIRLSVVSGWSACICSRKLEPALDSIHSNGNYCSKKDLHFWCQLLDPTASELCRHEPMTPLSFLKSVTLWKNILMLMTGVEFWRNSVDALTVLRILPYTLRSKSPDILIYTRGCWV